MYCLKQFNFKVTAFAFKEAALTATLLRSLTAFYRKGEGSQAKPNHASAYLFFISAAAGGRQGG